MILYLIPLSRRQPASSNDILPREPSQASSRHCRWNVPKDRKNVSSLNETMATSEPRPPADVIELRWKDELVYITPRAILRCVPFSLAVANGPPRSSLRAPGTPQHRAAGRIPAAAGRTAPPHRVFDQQPCRRRQQHRPPRPICKISMAWSRLLKTLLKRYDVFDVDVLPSCLVQPTQTPICIQVHLETMCGPKIRLGSRLERLFLPFPFCANLRLH